MVFQLQTTFWLNLTSETILPPAGEVFTNGYFQFNSLDNQRVASCDTINKPNRTLRKLSTGHSEPSKNHGLQLANQGHSKTNKTTEKLHKDIFISTHLFRYISTLSGTWMLPSFTFLRISKPWKWIQEPLPKKATGIVYKWLNWSMQKQCLGSM